MTKRFAICDDVHVKPGEAFEWLNSTDKDCTATKCKPPLEKNRYVVKKHSTELARAQKKIKPGDYEYDCECNGKKGQPKIIIGGA